MEQQERQTAYKVSIGALLKETPTFTGEKFNHIEVLGKNVSRISLIATVIDKYVSPEKPFVSLTIDDGTGQIRIKLFDKLEMVSDINIGDTILAIGWLKYFNNELYILPEIIKKMDVRWTMVRRLELEKSGIAKLASSQSFYPAQPEVQEPMPMQKKAEQEEVETERVDNNRNNGDIKEKTKTSFKPLTTPPTQLTKLPKNIKDGVLEAIKNNDEGIDIDDLIMQLNYPVAEINSTVTELIEEGKIYEPQPGKVRSIS